MFTIFHLTILITLWLGFWAFRWSHNGWHNTALKVCMSALAVWGAYALYTDNITKYYVIASAVYLYWFATLWSSEGWLNKVNKYYTFVLLSITMAFIFVNRMFG